MNDESLMPWGKYKGKKMVEVPDEYLLWIYDMGKVRGDLLVYIYDNLKVIRSNIKFKAGQTNYPFP